MKFHQNQICPCREMFLCIVILPFTPLSPHDDEFEMLLAAHIELSVAIIKRHGNGEHTYTHKIEEKTY